MLVERLSVDTKSKFYSEDWMVDVLVPDRSVGGQKDLTAAAFERGLVDYCELRKALDDGTIRFIVVASGRPPATFLGEETARFTHVKDVDDCSVYARKREGDPLTGALPGGDTRR